jgi:chemotaxis protein methyltransferase CheR
MEGNTELHFFNKLLDIIFEATNLDCRQYSQEYIKRRINSRLLANGLQRDDYFSYIKFLEGNLQEIRDLFNALTVNVTKFFRDSELWSFLKSDVLPKLIEEKKAENSGVIYVWSSGCASGEEPYSIAILLTELTKGTKMTFKVIASDIDELSLVRAKAGLYDLLSMSDTPPEYVLKYFKTVVVDGKKLYKLDNKIMSHVTFQRNNFLSDEPIGYDYDMVFCRNVIIYFTLKAKEKVINLFHKLLAEHGWLVTGKSEILFAKHLHNKFYSYNDIERVYRKERRREGSKVNNDRRKNWWHGYEELSINTDEAMPSDNEDSEV